MTQRLSDKAYELIIEFEVGGGRKYYDANLKTPTWPGQDSGVTVGIGYDCGYNEASAIVNDWTSAGLNQGDAKRLASTAHAIGQMARGEVKKVKDIVVPWHAAWNVFNDVTLPKFIRQTLKTFPGAELKLPADAFGALVSLVFNRGSSLTGPRREQMRTIRGLIEKLPKGQRLQDQIADQIRAMIPLWKGTAIYAGMKRRRNSEADLVETAKWTP
jgi:GH24 family phage-related lysozyme (muramidase)